MLPRFLFGPRPIQLLEPAPETSGSDCARPVFMSESSLVAQPQHLPQGSFHKLKAPKFPRSARPKESFSALSTT